MSVRDDLLNAKAELETHGWTQGTGTGGPTSPKCAAVAISYACRIASPGLTATRERCGRACAQLCTVIGDDGIIDWNDAYGREKADVLDALQTAADTTTQTHTMTNAQTTQTTEILERAHELIEQGWTKLASARDAHGTLCSAHDPRATCWCLTGAIRRAAYDTPGASTSHTAETLLLETIPTLDAYNDGMTLAGFNDNPYTTRDDILQALTKAIEHAA